MKEATSGASPKTQSQQAETLPRKARKVHNKTSHRTGTGDAVLSDKIISTNLTKRGAARGALGLPAAALRGASQSPTAPGVRRGWLLEEMRLQGTEVLVRCSPTRSEISAEKRRAGGQRLALGAGWGCERRRPRGTAASAPLPRHREGLGPEALAPPG